MDPEDTLDDATWESRETCSQCGGSIGLEFERAFAFDPEHLLCWGCAVERGGQYDTDLDSWVVAPDIADLID